MSTMTLPEALRRARPLLTDPPDPDQVHDGYLDLLGETAAVQAVPNQSAWDSRTISAMYDNLQSLVRKVATTTRLQVSASTLPDAARVLDVGCGPGNLTGDLGRACGPNGLALGLDISAPLLERAAAESRANTGFLRADARELPFHDNCFHAVTSIAAVHNIPEPNRALREFVRVLAPGGRLIVMALAADSVLNKFLAVLTNQFNVTGLDPDQVAEVLHSAGIATVHTRRSGPLLWLNASKGDHNASATP